MTVPTGGEAAAVKRLRMRAWHRGMREMDLILGPFAEARAAGMDPDGRRAFEALLAENDQELYQWVTGRAAPPPPHAPLVAEIADHFRSTRPD